MCLTCASPTSISFPSRSIASAIMRDAQHTLEHGVAQFWGAPQAPDPSAHTIASNCTVQGLPSQLEFQSMQPSWSPLKNAAAEPNFHITARLRHLYQKGEHPQLSEPISVDFSHLSITCFPFRAVHLMDLTGLRVVRENVSVVAVAPTETITLRFFL